VGEVVTAGALAFDALLCLTLVFIAWRLIGMSDLFRAVMLFVVFGLLMSVAWVRLQAVDVALAEAAIGAGLTGALFLAALARLRQGSGETAAATGTTPREGETEPGQPGSLDR
jgi:uncharacterized MnhB-related membrane protein